MSLIVSLSEYISLLLSLSLVYGLFSDRAQRLHPLARNIVTSLIFGGFAAFSMLIPFHVEGGIYVDGRGPIIGVAGAFGGPLSGLVAALFVSAYRISLGGVGVVSGVGSAVVAAVLGIGLHLYLRRSGRGLNGYWLLILGLSLIINGMFWTVVLPAETNRRVFQEIAIPSSLFYPLGTVLLGMLLNQQQRKYETERALRENERVVQRIFHTIPDAVYVLDVNDQENIYSNQRVRRLLGYAPDADSGQTNIQSWIHPQDILPLLQHLQQLQYGSDTDVFEIEYRMKDAKGEWRWINSRNLAFKRAPDGTVAQLIGVAQDITARKQADEALRENERRFRAIFNSSFQWTALLSPDGTRLAVNQTLLDFGGQRAEDVIGLPLWEAKWWEYSPEIQERFKDAVARAAQGDLVRFEITMRRADNAKRTNDLSVKPVKDEHGQVVLLIAEGRDITEQKQIAQERMEQEIERQRAELLRDFVTAASHDFKTPLTVMSLNLELMRRTRDPDKLQQRLDTLEKQVWRLNRMLEDMMVMLRLDAGYQSFPLASLEVNGLAREVFEAHQPAALEKRLELRFQPAAGALLVLADEDDLNLALSKLIDNAIHFTPDGGKITLAVSTSESRAIIEVRDTGSGISAEDLPHIFDQFYRADKARSMETGGSGLGLPIAKRIIELHDGTLDAESTLGGGSTFRISLPLSSEAVESALEAIGNGVVPSKSSSDAQGGRDVQARETPIEE